MKKYFQYMQYWSATWPKGSKRCFTGDHDCIILVQLPPSLRTLLRCWIRVLWWSSLLDGFYQAGKLTKKKSKNQSANFEMDNS